MTHLQVEDLEQNRDLDEQAYRDVCGGFAGFLSGLFAPAPGSGGMPSITNNVFIDYDYTQNVFQQNPVNLSIGAGDNSIVAIEGGISIMPVSAGSPMTFVYGG